jgi:hydroxybutyrate-dimer hydrolase
MDETARLLTFAAALVLGACATTPREERAMQPVFEGEIRVTEHRGQDDLLSGGLGLAGLASPTPPAGSDAAALRRRALHANWRGIADLAGGGFADIANVPGREFSAFARVAGASTTHRVLAQVPDAFDAKQRCLVVAPASGSRGVYGAIAVASRWALPRGCAVAFTDKGAGTGFVDLGAGDGVALDGTRVALASGTPVEFAPAGRAAQPHRVAIKHAHSGDNPEAQWGQHVLAAARFGLHALGEAFPDQAQFTAANTRVIALGLSNGGGAVLKAGEQDEEGLIDAVVAVAPNIAAPGARTLFDVGTEAALYQPCALLALADAPAMLPEAAWKGIATLRCASLKEAGLVAGADPAAQAADALARLRAGGWEDGALANAGINVAFDLWRAVVATYVQSYARAGVDAPVCGYEFAAIDAAGAARATTAEERTAWWSDASGIAPTAGIGIVDGMAAGVDRALPALRCARALGDGTDATAKRVQDSLAAIRATGRPRVAFTLVVHGLDDGLIPVAFTSRPWVEAARANGAPLAFWQVPRAQHFDAFLAAPPLRARWRALLPFAYEGMDAVWAMLAEGGQAPVDRVVD